MFTSYVIPIETHSSHDLFENRKWLTNYIDDLNKRTSQAATCEYLQTVVEFEHENSKKYNSILGSVNADRDFYQKTLVRHNTWQLDTALKWLELNIKSLEAQTEQAHTCDEILQILNEEDAAHELYHKYLSDVKSNTDFHQKINYEYRKWKVETNKKWLTCYWTEITSRIHAVKNSIDLLNVADFHKNNQKIYEKILDKIIQNITLFKIISDSIETEDTETSCEIVEIITNDLKFVNNIKNQRTRWEIAIAKNWLKANIQEFREMVESITDEINFLEIDFKLTHYREHYKSFIEIINVDSVANKNFIIDHASNYNAVMQDFANKKREFKQPENPQPITALENEFLYNQLKIKLNAYIDLYLQKIEDQRYCGSVRAEEFKTLVNACKDLNSLLIETATFIKVGKTQFDYTAIGFFYSFSQRSGTRPDSLCGMLIDNFINKSPYENDRNALLNFITRADNNMIKRQVYAWLLISPYFTYALDQHVEMQEFSHTYRG